MSSPKLDSELDARDSPKQESPFAPTSSHPFSSPASPSSPKVGQKPFLMAIPESEGRNIKLDDDEESEEESGVVSGDSPSPDDSFVPQVRPDAASNFSSPFSPVASRRPAGFDNQTTPVAFNRISNTPLTPFTPPKHSDRASGAGSPPLSKPLSRTRTIQLSPDQLASKDGVVRGLDDATNATNPVNYKRLPCPEPTASIFSQVMFFWLNPMIKLGNERSLEENDLYELREDFKAAELREDFLNGWEVERDRAFAAGDIKKASVSKVFHQLYWKAFWLSGVALCIQSGAMYGSPLLLEQLLLFLVDPQQPVYKGYLIISGFLFLPLVNTVMMNLYARHSWGVAIKIRAALTGAIYEKSLKLTPAARVEMSTGKIMNLVAADTAKVEGAISWFHFAWVSVVQLFIAIGLLIRALGWPAMIGCGIMVLIVPIQQWLIERIKKYSLMAMEYSDERIKGTSEILTGIRVIKFYSWEKSFSARVEGNRDKELNSGRTINYYKAFNTILTQLAPIFMSMGTFVVMSALDRPLSAAAVFSSLVLFNQLRIPIIMFPAVASAISTASVSMDRFRDFLLADELEEYTKTLGPGDSLGKNNEYSIQFIDAELNWEVTKKQLEKNTRDLTALKQATNKNIKNRRFTLTTLFRRNSVDHSIASGTSEMAAGTRRMSTVRNFRGSIALPPSQAEVEQREQEKNKLATIEDSEKEESRGKVAPELLKATAGPGAKYAWASGSGVESMKRRALDSVKATKAPLPVVPSVLRNLNLSIPKGCLCAVVGAVGSGKSSLLSGLLNELKLVRGEVFVSGSVSYCPQQAWIQNSTVRENIVFGQSWDPVKYAKTVEACCLERDFTILAAGDLTELGERGVNLSGGQRQRISLARSVYFGADITLLDDVLSAVDAHVGAHLFEHCIRGALSGSTRILVTHQLQYLNQCDYIVYLKDGQIDGQGNFDELYSVNAGFRQIVNEHGAQHGASGEENSSSTGSPAKNFNRHGHKKSIIAVGNTGLRKSSLFSNTSNKESRLTISQNNNPSKSGNEAVVTEGTAGGPQEAENEKAKKQSGRLMTSETRQRGKVSWQMYKFYIDSFGSRGYPLTIFFTLLISTGNSIFSNLWLAWWSDRKFPEKSLAFYMIIYSATGFSTAIFTAILILTTLFACLNASRFIHSKAFLSLLRAPLSYFDTTPVGRIMNVFSKDLDIIDSAVSDSLRLTLQTFVGILGAFIMIGIVTPLFAPVIVPFLYLYYKNQLYFRLPRIELKRLDSTTRSPLFSHFSESLTGLSTIRAYRQQEVFVASNAYFMDLQDRSHFVSTMSQRWIGVRLDVLGGFVVFIAALFLVIDRGNNTGGMAGLSMSYALQITGSFAMLVRQLVENENNMNSVERINQFIQVVPHEDDEEDEGHEKYNENLMIPPKEWPTRGKVEFQNVQMRYRPHLPLVLKGVSFTIQGGERIGIVGRTGAGKSSIMLTLFRICESQGNILIDELSTKNIPLAILRSSLAIIPQDPIIYSGTLRFNLDPFTQYTDTEIWFALEKARLKDRAMKMPKQLDSEVAEGGENFSVGERCQICLARALLKRAKILLLDEATANLDGQSDAAIQLSLREAFKETTMLVIAHRLNTIMDMDRVLVLDDGQVAEFDSPAQLLRNSASLFKSLCAATGEENANALMQIAFHTERQKKRLLENGGGADEQKTNKELSTEIDEIPEIEA